MTRIHDMGGRYGDGPVEPEVAEPVFHSAWEARALALTLAVGARRHWSLDTFRYSREALSPKDYSRFGYFEKWLASLANLVLAGGLVTRDELSGASARETSPDFKALRPEQVEPMLRRGNPSERAGDEAVFAIGDRVRTRLPARNVLVQGGHTRLPSYAAGHIGIVLRSHGCHVLPDSNAHFLGEAPEPLYSVVFDAVDLWGSAENAGDEVILDLWQSYLVPA
jgi:nitrile hydratase beta subunit